MQHAGPRPEKQRTIAEALEKYNATRHLAIAVAFRKGLAAGTLAPLDMGRWGREARRGPEKGGFEIESGRALEGAP